MDERNLIDISMTIEEGMPVYPGNPEPEIEKYRELPEDSTTESRIVLGSHTGTHVDGEEHTEENGRQVSDIELTGFYGRCQVIDMTSTSSHIKRSDLESKDLREDIILIRTQNSKEQRESFREDFIGLKKSAVDYMIEKDVKTVGVDYLSLTKYNGDEKDYEAHRKGIKEMNVIEGLDLGSAEEGEYTFSGFPIKIRADGAPLRAVLIEEK